MSTLRKPETPGVWAVLRPHDTVQVRDGRSFDAGAGGVAHSVRPWPSTIAGALAAGLGGEPESVRGPFLARRRGREWRPHFTAPLDLVTEPGTEDVWRQLPPACADEDRADGNAVGGGDGEAASWDLEESTAPLGHTGLGALRLPARAGETEPVEGLVPAEVLESYLHGDLVRAGQAISLGELEIPVDPVSAENRIGVGLDAEARTVKGGLLYRATHLRLAEEWAFAAHLSPRAGRHRALEEVNEPVRLGGLTRLADLEGARITAWPTAPDTYPEGRVLVYLATPAVWPSGWLPPLPGNARVVAARLDEPLPVATASPVRDFRHFQSTRTLAWAVPPGSLYLLQFPNPGDAEAWAHPQHGRALGPAGRKRWDTAGFGVVLTGVWS